MLPVAVPGLVYGIGLIWTWLPTPVYGTVWILLIAYVAKFLPYGVVVSRTGLLQMHPELEESARVHGAGPVLAIKSSIASDAVTYPAFPATAVPRPSAVTSTTRFTPWLLMASQAGWVKST